MLGRNLTLLKVVLGAAVLRAQVVVAVVAAICCLLAAVPSFQFAVHSHSHRRSCKLHSALTMSPAAASALGKHSELQRATFACDCRLATGFESMPCSLSISILISILILISSSSCYKYFKLRASQSFIAFHLYFFCVFFVCSPFAILFPFSFLLQIRPRALFNFLCVAIFVEFYFYLFDILSVLL